MSRQSATWRCDWVDPEDRRYRCTAEFTTADTGTSPAQQATREGWEWNSSLGPEEDVAFQYCPVHKSPPEIKPWHWYRDRWGRAHVVTEVDAIVAGESGWVCSMVLGLGDRATPLSECTDWDLIGPCEVPS